MAVTQKAKRSCQRRLAPAVMAAIGLMLGPYLKQPLRAATLVENGHSRATIVIEAHPPPETRQAVKELASYIKHINGADVKVVSSGDSVSTPVTIWIGLEQKDLPAQFPGQDLNLKGYEEGLIVVADDHVLIAGNDGKVNGPSMQRGTAEGIYAFIEKYLDVRWLWPGDLGTDVPHKGTIELQNVVDRYTPALKQRHLRLQGYEEGIKEYLETHSSAPESELKHMTAQMVEWQRRHRTQSHFVSAGHAFTRWWSLYHQTHPDYFALQPDGTRNPYPRPDRVKLDVSQPAVAQQWLANAADQLRNRNRFIVSASPNDSEYDGYCTCPRCAAWDNPRGKIITLRWKHKKAQHVALTDRYARFWNVLAQGLKASHTGRTIYVGAWAYGAYRTPPVSLKLEDNIIVGYIGGFPEYDLARRVEERKNWLGWANQVNNMVWRPNLFYYDRGMPLAFMHRSAEDFAWLADHKMMGLDVDSIYGHWALQGVQYYVLAELAWNPHLNVDKLLDDYMTRAFGSGAAPYMRRYFDKLEQVFYKKAERDATVDKDGRVFGLPTIYSPSVLAELQSLLDQGRRAVGNGALADIHRKRLDFYQAGLTFTKLQIGAISAMAASHRANGDRHGAYERAVQAAQQRNEFLDLQLDSFSMNTALGYKNWCGSSALRDWFGPPNRSSSK